MYVHTTAIIGPGVGGGGGGGGKLTINLSVYSPREGAMLVRVPPPKII